MNTGPIVALVPMRADSERVPNKNVRPCAGPPLFHYILRALASSGVVSEIVVDTDSAAVQAGCRDAFPLVRLIERPSHLRGGHVSMNELILHDLSRVEGEVFLQTHATNPLLRPATIARAVAAFRTMGAAHDSLLAVTRLRARFWDASAKPLNHDPNVLVRTQDLEPVFQENSCIYLFTRRVFSARSNRVGSRPLLFAIDPEEAWDIDEEFDFAVAEALLARRRQEGR